MSGTGLQILIFYREVFGYPQGLFILSMKDNFIVYFSLQINNLCSEVTDSDIYILLKFLSLISDFFCATDGNYGELVIVHDRDPTMVIN